MYMCVLWPAQQNYLSRSLSLSLSLCFYLVNDSFNMMAFYSFLWFLGSLDRRLKERNDIFQAWLIYTFLCYLLIRFVRKKKKGKQIGLEHTICKLFSLIILIYHTLFVSFTPTAIAINSKDEGLKNSIWLLNLTMKNTTCNKKKFV